MRKSKLSSFKYCFKRIETFKFLVLCLFFVAISGSPDLRNPLQLSLRLKRENRQQCGGADDDNPVFGRLEPIGTNKSR